MKIGDRIVTVSPNLINHEGVSLHGLFGTIIGKCDDALLIEFDSDICGCGSTFICRGHDSDSIIERKSKYALTEGRFGNGKNWRFFYEENLKLLETKVQAKSQAHHKCPLCGNAGDDLVFTFYCSNKSCRNYRP